MNLVGPDCSSWGIPARSVSCRSWINPYGNLQNAWVTSNNELISRRLDCNSPVHMDRAACVKSRCFGADVRAWFSIRLVLLLLLALACHTTFVIEQPGQSILGRHRRWEWFVNRTVRALRLCILHLSVHTCVFPATRSHLLCRVLGILFEILDDVAWVTQS